MANRRGKRESNDRIYFLGLQMTVDSDCSHEIKRHLLLGRKAMTNLDSILKSRDVTWPTFLYGMATQLQYSCLENPHGQRRLVGYSPWGHRVRQD